MMNAVSQLLWSREGRDEWFSLRENHERRGGFPGFPARGSIPGPRCAAFFTESRMEFDCTNKLHRKSGFGLNQLRNRYTRRKFLGSAVAAGVCSRLAIARDKRLRIGVTDWNLNLGANPEAVPLAAKLGFEGVQISFGRKLVDDKMPLDDPAVS